MNTLVQPSSIKSKVSGASFLARLKMAGSTGVQKVRKRFQSAAQEFRDVVSAEERVRARAAEKSRPVIQTTARYSLGGFLISQTSNRVFPLYEGNNYFSVSQSGDISHLIGEIESASDVDYKVRLQGDQVESELTGDVSKPGLFVTNDLLTLGCEPFLVKLLPGEHRLEQEIKTVKEETE